MSRGGARIRSGPQKDPNSERSRAIGYTLNSLPAAENTDPAPEFPLAIAEDYERAEREKEIWEWLWRQPQSRAWIMPQNAYLIYDIGMYARLLVSCEDPDAKSADRLTLLRLADRIGLSPAGLAALGWKIVADTPQKTEKESAAASNNQAVQPRRLRG